MAQVFFFIVAALSNEPLTSKKDLVFKWNFISLSISFLSFTRPVIFNIQKCSDLQIAPRAHAACPDSQILVQKKPIKTRTRTRW